MTDMEIREVNFVASNVCNASCVFCPRSFVDVLAFDRFMSVATVEKVLSEVTSGEFRREHLVCHSVLSENGEPFLNPDILDILRAVRKAGLAISLFTNFALLFGVTAEAFLRENLCDTLHVNIDGANEESYRAAKGMPLKRVRDNLAAFLDMRERMKAPVRLAIHIMPFKKYHDKVLAAFGVPPVKADGLRPDYDAHLVMAEWAPKLRADDFIGEDNTLLWAERYNDKPRAGDFRCPNLPRVRHCAYINPRGDWYACCFDMGNELVLGNVNEQSVLEIANSVKRQMLIAQLETRQFDQVGFPCTRVDACQIEIG